MPAAGGELSEAVRAAQERLWELRREHGAAARGRARCEAGARATAPLLPCLPPPPLAYHSRHTSEPLIAHLRAAAARRAAADAAGDRAWLAGLHAASDERRATSDEPASHASRVTPHASRVKVYPDIALGLLRRKKAAPGRVWLLLRHADVAGRGRVAVAEAARLLSGDGSPLRICGRRQLANLLAAGDGLFWQRDRGRDGADVLRLQSAARVAAGLGVARLGGSPVAVPVGELTGTIGRARAHLYATFHSGRAGHDLLTGERRARGPIARETLCKLSGASRNSQRNYERRAVVGRRSAIALGPRLSTVDEHDFAWQRGRALFHYRDRQGRYGRPGAVYLAWQLPNEYTGPHATLPRGGQKRLNRAIADLFHNGMTGNGDGIQSAASGGRWSGASGRARQFYSSAKAAFLARGERERYWRQGGVWLWQGQVTNDERRATREADNRSPAASGHPEPALLPATGHARRF